MIKYNLTFLGVIPYILRYPLLTRSILLRSLRRNFKMKEDFRRHHWTRLKVRLNLFLFSCMKSSPKQLRELKLQDLIFYKNNLLKFEDLFHRRCIFLFSYLDIFLYFFLAFFQWGYVYFFFSGWKLVLYTVKNIPSI